MVLGWALDLPCYLLAQPQPRLCCTQPGLSVALPTFSFWILPASEE